MVGMPQIGVEQVVQGNDKFNRDMAKYEKTLVGAGQTTDKFTKKTSSDFQEVDKSARKASEGTQVFGSGLSMVKNLVGAGFLLGVVRGLKDFSAASIDAASSFAEVESKFNVVFKETAPGAREELENFAASINRSSANMLGFASTIQDTLVPLGFAREKAAELSVDAVQLATDLGSFNNVDPAAVINDLQSALVGSGEVMKKYGVILNVSTTEQELLNMGIMGGYEAATEQEKALARLNVVLKGTSDAQGDAARTMDSNANMTLAMKDAIFELQLAIGQGLIPTTNRFIDVVTEGATRLTDLIKISQLMKDAFKEQEQGAFNTAKTYDEYVKSVLDARERTGDLNNITKQIILTNIQNGVLADDIAEKYLIQSEAAFKLSNMTAETVDQHRRLQNVYQELPPVIEETTVTLEDQAAANIEAKETTTLLKDAVDAGAISQYEYELMTLQAKDGTLELSEAQIAQIESAIASRDANALVADAMKAQRDAAGEAALAYIGLVEAYSQDDVNVYAGAIRNLEQAIKDTGDPTGELTSELLEMKIATGEATAEGELLSESADKLGRFMEAGIIPISSQGEALADWQAIVDGGTGSVDDIIQKYGDFGEANEEQIRALETGGEAWVLYKQDALDPATASLMAIGGEDGAAPTTSIALSSMSENIAGPEITGKLSDFATGVMSEVAGSFKTLWTEATKAKSAIYAVVKALEDIDGMSANVYLNVNGGGGYVPQPNSDGYISNYAFTGEYDQYGDPIRQAKGGDFIVPPEFTNDSFPILAEAGERVTVVPKSEMIRQASLGSVTNNAGNTYNVSVNASGMSEAQAVRVVKTTIRQLEAEANYA